LFLGRATQRQRRQGAEGAGYVEQPGVGVAVGGEFRFAVPHGGLGRSIVCAASKQFQLLADNFLESGALATAALSANSIFLRTKTHLYRLEQ
jgi:hypothetical protein